MKKNNEPYIDPALFTKPPPNFKGAPSNWQSFKVPRPPVTPTSYKNPCSVPRNYTNGQTPNSVRNYKNEPPPNYPSGSSFQNSELPSTSKKSYNKTVMFNSVNMVQPFKPEVPPPPFNQNTSRLMTSSSSSTTISPNNTNGDEANYFLMMFYRYHNSANASQYSSSPNSFPLSPPSNSYSLPPPPTHFPPPQPPLPPLPPPQNPPLPPPPISVSPSTSMAVQNNHLGNYHNRMSPYSIYGHSYSNIHNNFKRKYDGNDAQKKLQKKKKKPLSQVVPQRRDWTVEEAKRALDVEKECNKRSKRQGLIIKFPDLELNRDIVSNFHTSIESVHFQQPSTPRYCFVTLTESADPETVIKQLNQIPFGLGYLSAEFKKDREDEQNIRPTDIDPLTLYVGNLAQEITKDDMTKTYPKQKRIDIGYAKKMKYTRYAFVSFHTVDDAIEAFQTTHSSQMYSKSLIVRFRRLHGTVGMPGEPKQQIGQRSESESSTNVSDNCNSSLNDESDKDHNPWDIDISHWENDYREAKCKRSAIPTSEDDDDEEMEVKPPSMKFTTRFKPGSLEVAFSLHKPKIITVKEEKEDEGYEDNREDYSYLEEGDNVSHLSDSQASNHERPRTNTEQQNTLNPVETQTVVSNIKRENTNHSAQSSSYEHLRNLHQQVKAGKLPVALNKSQNVVSIKKEKQDNTKEEINYSVSSSNIQESNRPYLPKDNNNTQSSSKVSESGISNEVVQNNLVVPESSSSNVQNINGTQALSDSANNDKKNPSSCNESENTSNRRMDERSDDCFGWMHMDYSTAIIKTESVEDYQVHDGGNDSSDDDLSMEKILHRARIRYKNTN